MQLPVMPPVSPMLAKSVTTIPPDSSYEPKWDGFPVILFSDSESRSSGQPQRTTDDPLLPRTRRGRPGRVAAAVHDRGRSSSPTALAWTSRRCSPACTRPPAGSGCTEQERLRTSSPLICWPSATTDYTGRPFTERRAALVDALAGSGSSFHVTPATTDLALAQRGCDEFEGAGLDGMVAEPLAIALANRTSASDVQDRGSQHRPGLFVAGYHVREVRSRAIRFAAARPVGTTAGWPPLV